MAKITYIFHPDYWAVLIDTVYVDLFAPCYLSSVDVCIKDGMNKGIRYEFFFVGC